LAIIGILMIYSATACITGDTLDLNSPSIRQGLYLLAGLVCMFGLTLIDYRIFGSLRWFIWIGTVGLLLVVFAIGVITHGAQRWLDLGLSTLQPSELTKLALILIVAKYMSDHEAEMSRWRFLAISFFFVAVPLVLVYLQPDLGTTIVLATTWGVMALASGMRLRDVLIVVAVGIVAAPLVWTHLRPYQQDRVLSFLDPAHDPLGSGYNAAQARIAIGSVQLWGTGFCGGTQSQLRFLRNRQTDFIFSVIGEELGFIGALFIIALLVFILFRLIRAARLARTTFGKLIAIGVMAMILVQSFVNMGMNLGLMPVTGIPLPFLSAGGSSLLSLMAAEGVVQSVLLRHKIA
jgi:rod shape determining protein RodA